MKKNETAVKPVRVNMGIVKSIILGLISFVLVFFIQIFLNRKSLGIITVSDIETFDISSALIGKDWIKLFHIRYISFLTSILYSFALKLFGNDLDMAVKFAHISIIFVKSFSVFAAINVFKRFVAKPYTYIAASIISVLFVPKEINTYAHYALLFCLCWYMVWAVISISNRRWVELKLAIVTFIYFLMLITDIQSSVIVLPIAVGVLFAFTKKKMSLINLIVFVASMVVAFVLYWVLNKFYITGILDRAGVKDINGTFVFFKNSVMEGREKSSMALTLLSFVIVFYLRVLSVSIFSFGLVPYFVIKTVIRVFGKGRKSYDHIYTQVFLTLAVVVFILIDALENMASVSINLQLRDIERLLTPGLTSWVLSPIFGIAILELLASKIEKKDYSKPTVICLLALALSFVVIIVACIVIMTNGFFNMIVPENVINEFKNFSLNVAAISLVQIGISSLVLIYINREKKEGMVVLLLFCITGFQYLVIDKPNDVAYNQADYIDYILEFDESHGNCFTSSDEIYYITDKNNDILLQLKLPETQIVTEMPDVNSDFVIITSFDINRLGNMIDVDKCYYGDLGNGTFVLVKGEDNIKRFKSFNVKHEIIDLSLPKAVNRLYNLIFLRNVDPDGYDYWAGVLERNDMSYSEVMKVFVGTSEFINKNYTPEETINFLYTFFYDEYYNDADIVAPTDEEMEYWLEKYDECDGDTATLIDEFYAQDDYVFKGTFTFEK